RLITMRWRLAYTPVYALLSEHGGHSIELAPLSALTQTGKSSDEDDSGFDEDTMDISTPEAWVATDTRVLLSVSISDDAACDITEWKKWLVTQAPVEVTKVEVKVEAVFKSHSTMLIISLPIMAWNCLPNKAAYQFVGFDKVMKEEAAISPAKQLNYSPWSKEHVPTSLEISQKEKSTSGTFDFAISPQSTQWTNEMDIQLQQARQQGHNWATIAKSYFPSRTADACRKRYEKVMENRRNEYTKFELLATLYAQLREYTWSKLAFAAGEHWSCMGNGLEILLSTAGVRQLSGPPSKADASSYSDFGDSAIWLDDESTELSGQRNVTSSTGEVGSLDIPNKFEVEQDFVPRRNGLF
ncbi:MAG: hypothetical protein L6R42_007104, partial [Xanthoria sp. 1 TBL-2021]